MLVTSLFDRSDDIAYAHPEAKDSATESEILLSNCEITRFALCLLYAHAVTRSIAVQKGVALVLARAATCNSEALCNVQKSLGHTCL